MTTPVFIAKLTYSLKDEISRTEETVGVFSTKRIAEEAIENFIEGVVNIERPSAKVLSRVVEEFVLDVAVNEAGPSWDKDGIPF